MTINITVRPCSSLIDEDVNIQVNGLLPLQKVTLRGFTRTENEDMFESFAFYQADKGGNIDITSHPSNGGMFTGVEPMGLFWALEKSSLNKRKNARMVKKDVTTPLIVEISVYNDWITQNTIHKESPISKVNVQKWYKLQSVLREPIRVGNIRGTLFTPPGDGPFKTVIDMFGGAGGLFEFRASMLASRGFLTLALAIYDYEDLPILLDFLGLEYFEEATQFMQSHPKHQKGGIGVVGVSFGSDIALAMGAYVPGVTCNVCINGSTYMNFPYRFRGYSTERRNLRLDKLINVEPDVIMTREMWDFPKDKNNIQNAMIEYYKSNASTLFIGSGDDGTFDNEFIFRRTKKVLKQYYGGNGKYKFKFYPGAGHLLELPNTALGTKVYVGRLKWFEYYGGKKLPHARAQSDSWKEILRFLNENIIPIPKSVL